MKVGSVVQLISGGPLMTVNGVTEVGSELLMIDVIWFTSDGNLCTYQLDSRLLVVIVI